MNLAESYCSKFFAGSWWQQGFSLVELLLAMALGLLLLTGIFTLYLNNKQTYLYTEGLARLQENGRMAWQYLNRDVRMTGNVGCVRVTKEIIPQNNNPDFSAATSLIGWHAGRSTATMPLPISLHPVAGTDLLLIQAAAPDYVSIKTINNNEITLVGHADFKANDPVVISNCQQFTFARVLAVNTNKEAQLLMLNTALSNRYASYAQLSHVLKIAYYIRNTGRKNQAGNVIYALYRRDLNGPLATPSELIAGIDNMQIFYRLANAGNIDYRADEVPDWSAVVAVRIVLLLDSEEAVNRQPRAYRFLGNTLLPNDRRLYREWSMVVTLREREFNSPAAANSLMQFPRYATETIG